jgi:competence protein ComEC
VIVAYVLAVGWQPSVARAAVAGALASLAWLASRPRDRWHFFAVGALVLMAWMPTSLLEPGFQLSFAAVAAIFVAVPRLRHKLDGLPLPPALAEALAVALSCGLATAPIVLVHFGQAPVYTVPANVLAFPAAPLVLGFGLLSAVVDPVSPSAAAGLSALAGWAAAWLELVAPGGRRFACPQWMSTPHSHSRSARVLRGSSLDRDDEISRRSSRWWRACSRPALLSSPPRGSRPPLRRRGTHRPASV